MKLKNYNHKVTKEIAILKLNSNFYYNDKIEIKTSFFIRNYLIVLDQINRTKSLISRNLNETM